MLCENGWIMRDLMKKVCVKLYTMRWTILEKAFYIPKLILRNV